MNFPDGLICLLLHPPQKLLEHALAVGPLVAADPEPSASADFCASTAAAAASAAAARFYRTLCGRALSGFGVRPKGGVVGSVGAVAAGYGRALREQLPHARVVGPLRCA